VFTIPATYAISLQLLGVILVLQLLPAVFFGLYVKSLRKEALIAGLLVGIFSGIFMVEYTNHFGALRSSLFNMPIFGSLYVAVVALALNLVVSFGGSSIINMRSALLQTKNSNT
jgi:solute:Na+ symporter, SSS family